ncbi:BspA family leucine-rich repeat surface protein [Mycoplasma capricolum]|uniref:BspA family leucine-rich repeat surface protein n=1 Tax=Mycoplasma capricolum TaxID=2095 RepID=UPI000629E68E|nr:BspA family leucine-rich repeat surface protein [Mycoplasma capricolum]KKW61789.1 Chitinase [Mycoplasma capricolum subsp. capricolum]
MKKVLIALGSVSLIVTTSSILVACSDIKNKNVKGNLNNLNFNNKENRKVKNQIKDQNQENFKDKKVGRENIDNLSANNETPNLKKIKKDIENNIFSRIEDERNFILKNYNWLTMNKKGEVDHFINPDDSSEILVLGYEKEKDGYKLKQIPKHIKKVPPFLPKFITNLEKSFQFNQNEKIIGIEKWDTKKVKNMFQMFFGAENFNYDISNWDTSNVENMNYMFSGAKNFKQDLSKWKVEKTPFQINFAKDSGFENDKNLWPPFKQK